MDYTTISQKPQQFLSLTSLTVAEFSYLLDPFTLICEKYYRYHTLEGRKRKHPQNKEHGNACLKGATQKLFFLLVYLKTNSLQEHQAASFGVSQSKVSRFIKTLLPILQKTLKQMGYTPYRDGEVLKDKLGEHPTKVFYYDGTDRNIPRNTDKAAQKVEYSGKHCQHTVKNITLCDDSQYIHYLSPTELGSIHDKTIADEYPIFLPIGSVLKQDLGFLGHTPEGINIEIPFKKPPNKELNFSKKLYNKILASTRVLVEHANSGIKRLKIVKDTIRLRGTDVRDNIILVASALHNLRVKSTERAYTSRA